MSPCFAKIIVKSHFSLIGSYQTWKCSNNRIYRSTEEQQQKKEEKEI